MKNKTVIYLRRSILLILTLLVTYAAYQHQVFGGQKSPSIHALCPFGGLESFYQIFAAGSLIPKIFAGTMILFLITVVLAVIFRRSFCGLICPFGAIQEFFALIGRKIFKQQWQIPAALDRPARYLKYLVLVVTVFFAWQTAGLWMSPYDPWAAYGHLSAGFSAVWAESAVGLVILLVSLLASLVYDRFFCKYLCPMGAFLGLVGKISPFHIQRNADKCIDCGKCSRICPANIDVQHTAKVTTAECFSCQTCVLNCPVPRALEAQIGSKRVRPLVTIALVLGIFFGAIFAFQAAGIYQVLPKSLEAGQIVAPGDLEGYLTIEEGIKATGLDKDAFYKAFQIPASVPPTTKMKEISTIIPEYDFHKIKESL